MLTMMNTAGSMEEDTSRAAALLRAVYIYLTPAAPPQAALLSARVLYITPAFSTTPSSDTTGE